jgi:hypothetical protein
MRKSLMALAACALVCTLSATASATANFVYHEQTNNFVATPADDPSPGCSGGGTETACGRYVENTDRSASAGFQIYSPETYTLHFKVEFQFFTNQVRVYYTTDGSNPCGSFGSVGNVTQPNGVPCGAGNTTQVAVAAYTCTYSDVTQSCQIVDVVTGGIPPQAAGATVKYVVSAWHSGGGDEIFANSGACGGCFPATSSSDATPFQYNVLAPPATPLIISEFRLRGTSGASDEFVEIYNNGDSDVTVNAFDGSAGFALAASDGVTRFTIPNGTTIPARGHYLGTNSVGYSLGSYPAAAPPPSGDSTRSAPPARGARAATVGRATVRGAVVTASQDPPGGPTAATGDVTYTTGIADNAGVALFNTANPANFTLANRLDAVGSTSEANALYKEGVGYPAIVATSNNYSFYRSLCSFVTGIGCTTAGTPKDSNDNASDLLYVSTDGTNQGAGARLGAPGPENSTSPIVRNASFGFALLDATVSSGAPPNRDRDFTSDPSNNSPQGTLTIRRRVVNNTGASVTRLRFRIIELTTNPPAPGFADLRARTSSDSIVTGINDPSTCAGLPAPCLRTVRGTTLEEASSPDDQPNGGGYNSSLSAGTVALATPLPPADNPVTVGVKENEIYVQFLLGVVQSGTFRFYINIEALP